MIFRYDARVVARSFDTERSMIFEAHGQGCRAVVAAAVVDVIMVAAANIVAVDCRQALYGDTLIQACVAEVTFL